MPGTQTSPHAMAALARRTPRYTSYPPIPNWDNDLGPTALRDAVSRVDGDAAVYVHVPFCWEQCWYCGCNMVVARRQAAGDRYLRALRTQLDALPLARDPMEVSRIHFGGGTPTWLHPDQLRELIAMLRDRFTPVSDAELSIEVHPGVTRPEHLDVLAKAGFTRLSVGVQSTDAKVLEAIGRVQTNEAIEAVIDGARARGFTGLNIDLVYGLPHQTPETLDRTLDALIAWRPDRVALYGYAHIPALIPKQAKIDTSALPVGDARTALFLQAGDRLKQAGWLALGLDHFALPTDPLSLAFKAGTLSRDFMGHTDRITSLIGLGPSAISEVGDVYVQQPSKLGAWYRAVEGDDPLPVARSHRLDAEQELRRDAIRTLMCQLRLDWRELGSRHGVDARKHFRATRKRLQTWAQADAVQLGRSGLEVTELGRLVLRDLAACFDQRAPVG